MQTPDNRQKNIEKIGEMFPECISEVRDNSSGRLQKKIDFNLLRSILEERSFTGDQERHGLNWPGRVESLVVNTVSASALRPVREESLHFETTQNLFIEGDNLEALKLLKNIYKERVKMIYIDPPYNKGADLIYRDTFVQDQESYEIRSGERALEGDRLVSNPDTNGRFHSDWLNMIVPRLKLSKDLLTPDGAIFVSIDQNEHPRLRLIMDEIFGESNFVADIVWAAGRKNQSQLVSVSHEYIVCYARDRACLKKAKVKWRTRKRGLEDIYSQHDRLKRQHGDDYDQMTLKLKEWYANLNDGDPAKDHRHYCHVDARGIYFPDNISSPSVGGKKYKINHPVTKFPVKTPSNGWRFPPDKMQKMIDEDRICFGLDENSVPSQKSYLKDREYSVPYSVFYQDGRGASKRLAELMGGKVFPFPKDEIVLQQLIEGVTGENDIVLDFFAGTSTTAHSVMLQNADDGKNRKFIMVQLDEQIKEGEIAFKAGFTTISAISRERIRRAGKKMGGGISSRLESGCRLPCVQN